MSNTTQSVWEILSNDVSIRKDLARGIINSRALAKYLMNNYDLDSGIDGIISAIRRFERDPGVQERFQTVKQSLNGSKLSTRTNLACITYDAPSDADGLIFSLVKQHKQGVWMMAKGENTLKVILNQDFLQGIEKHLVSASSTKKGLAEVHVSIGDKAVSTKGLFARITNEIANQDVNIEEVLTVAPELILLVKNEDIVKAHDAVLGLVTGRP